MAVKAASTPRDLGGNGRKLWRKLAQQVADDGLILDERELFLLHAACRETDMLARIEAALEGADMTVRGAQGNWVAHPLLGEARRSRAQVASLLKQIGLTDPHAGTATTGQPMSVSEAGRKGGYARHGRGA